MSKTSTETVVPAEKTATGRRGGRVAVRLEGDARPAIPAKPVRKTTSATKPAKRRGEDVRERVLEAALECFGAFGFEGTSTRAVAERANVTHTLVLYHFQSKDQLWTNTVEHALQGYGNEIKETFDTADQREARAALSEFIEKFVRMSARTPQVHRILTMEGNQESERLNWVVDRFIRWHFNQARELIRRGQVEGTVRQCDPARLYYHIIGAGGTPFTIATEYKAMTGRDVFSEAEILRTTAFIFEIVFI
jgi:AcrR family transcriptional regulator